MTVSGGTAGCVLAGRLAENSDLSILLVEAGPSNDAVPASAMPAGLVFPIIDSITEIVSLISVPSWAQVVGTEADWNIKSEASSQLNHRRLDLHRGRYHTKMHSGVEKVVISNPFQISRRFQWRQWHIVHSWYSKGL